MLRTLARGLAVLREAGLDDDRAARTGTRWWLRLRVRGHGGHAAATGVTALRVADQFDSLVKLAQALPPDIAPELVLVIVGVDEALARARRRARGRACTAWLRRGAPGKRPRARLPAPEDLERGRKGRKRPMGRFDRCGPSAWRDDHYRGFAGVSEPDAGRGRSGDTRPFRVPAHQRTPAFHLQLENTVAMRNFGRSRWRDPDSNRGHHDFQSWTEIALTTLKVPQFRGFALPADDEEKSAISILFSRIQAPERTSVPKRLYGPALASVKVRPTAVKGGECTHRADYPM